MGTRFFRVSLGFPPPKKGGTRFWEGGSLGFPGGGLSEAPALLARLRTLGFPRSLPAERTGPKPNGSVSTSLPKLVASQNLKKAGVMFLLFFSSFHVWRLCGAVFSYFEVRETSKRTQPQVAERLHPGGGMGEVVSEQPRKLGTQRMKQNRTGSLDSPSKVMWFH